MRIDWNWFMRIFNCLVFVQVQETSRHVKTSYLYHQAINSRPSATKISRERAAWAGERQLLAFARVLAFDPDILILDEATANIDSVSEKQIQKATEVVTRGRYFELYTLQFLSEMTADGDRPGLL